MSSAGLVFVALELHVCVRLATLSLHAEEHGLGALTLISLVHLLLPSVMMNVLSPSEILKVPRLCSMP